MEAIQQAGVVRLREEEEQVMSEVHLGCPPNHSGPHISHFTISLPPPLENSTFRGRADAVDDVPISTSTVYDLDEDGDLILTRRKKSPSHCLVLTIQHNITSSIPRVGLQVWRAELVLADFVLHVISTSSDFDEVVALELGAGTGLVGIVLARVAKTVFITDHGDEVLENCEKTVDLNAEIFHGKGSVHVRELDWRDSWPPREAKITPSEGRYTWSLSEIEELKKASLLLAADVIYSDDLTDAFFSILRNIMSDNPEKVLFLALEKRYNFTLDDLNVVANGYSHFRSYLITAADDAGCEQLDSASEPFFVGEQIDMSHIPCYVREYDRGNDVEIWKIKCRMNQSALF